MNQYQVALYELPIINKKEEVCFMTINYNGSSIKANMCKFLDDCKH
ncbi:hypothetical protein J4455_03045 [Candidatus Woesearchaeota archaeon]|nr:hypothetical protein [Candidatus Woesearchaeota archaeon]